jgi:hypothetical protein
MGKAIYLPGGAAEVGTLQGTLQKTFLQERAARFERMMHNAGVNKSTFTPRLAAFEECLLAAAPHWLEEANAVARAAGLELWQLLLWNLSLPELPLENALPAPLTLKTLAAARAGDEGIVNPYEAQGTDPAMGEGECTTFFTLGDSTTAGENLLHKNRDSRDELQNIYIKHINGFRRFVGSGDLGNLGTAHLHSEELFAGANNTGSPLVEGQYQENALNDCHTLRYIGEHCAGLDDIVPCLEDLQSRQLLGGGGAHGRGMILIFADAHQGLIIEATSRKLHHQFFQDDAIAVRTNHFEFPEMQVFCAGAAPGSEIRARRAQELLEPLSGLMDIATCGEISRDRENAPYAICRNPSDELGTVTVSTATATLSAHDDRRCQTHFRNGHPGYCPPVILSPSDIVSDSDLVSGAHHDHWRGFRGWI